MKSFTVEPEVQSDGSQGGVFQRPPDDDFDDGLNHPVQDDLLLLQLDMT